MYGTILLVIHILGAIAGIGPTFAFGVIGAKAGKEPGAALTLLEVMMDIEKKLVTPVALFTQPISGVLLITHFGYDKDFFSNTWLVYSIVAFAAILIMSYGPNNKAVHRLVKAMRAGEMGTPTFLKDLKTTKTLGPIMGILTFTIVIMMVWKPTL